MPENAQVNEFMKASSHMASELEEVFDECKKLKSSEILVPQDVRQRMKEICVNCEKIIKDMPNKRFSASVHLHSREKAKNYLDTINEKVQEFDSNRTNFVYLSSFYGNVGKYTERMLKCNKKFESIVFDVRKLVEKNPKLFENKKLNVVKTLEPCKEDKKLVSLGRIRKDLVTDKRDYKDHVKAYFEKFTTCYKSADGKKLPDLFREVSYSLNRIKDTVNVNEKDKALGIEVIRHSIIGDMSKIVSKFNRYTETAEKNIAFLQSLPIEDSSMAETRKKNINDLNKLLGEYAENLRKMDKVKSNVLYGETRTKKRGYGQKEVLFANTMRKNCKKITSGIRKVLSDVKGGEAVNIVSEDAKTLDVNFKIFTSETVTTFIGRANNFEGYFKNLTEKDKTLLDDKRVKYDDIQDSLNAINIKLDRTDDSKNMDSMAKKLKKELEEYNKTSSKIKRGVKKVLGVAKTMAKYVAYLSTFINTVVGLSNNFNALVALFSSGEEETIEVPIEK